MFAPNEDVWNWLDGPFRVNLNFRNLTIDPALNSSLKNTLIFFSKGSSAKHLINLFQAFRHFVDSIKLTSPLESITVQMISDYAYGLKEHERGRLSTLNVLLQKWVSFGLSGVDSECTRYLRERRKPGNTKGAAVRTRDPVNGPFSEAEYTALYKSVDAAYGQGEIPLWIIVLTRLLFACGGRTSQYASLKILDFKFDTPNSFLSLPQVKTRESHARVSFLVFEISPQTSDLISEYIAQLKNKGHGDDAALFPQSEITKYGFHTENRYIDDIFVGHTTVDALSFNFIKIISDIAPLSERLNFERLTINPRRFRYTYGTRLAEEGASKNIIANRLGHVDLQNVDVYFEASPKIVENIDRAMSAQLAPLAYAFRGRLIETEDQSTHKGALGSQIIDFRISSKPLGNCGCKGKGCSFNKPVACYTCFKFEPWLDAPHEKILQRLMKERFDFGTDERMAAVNDESIRAIQQVIGECAEVYEQRLSGSTE